MKRLRLCAGWLLALLCSAASAEQPSGTLDLSFGTDFGRTTIGFDLGGGLSDVSRALVRGPGDRLYLIGSVQFAPNGSQQAIGMVRLHPDGTIDTGFGANGKEVYKEPTFQRMIVNDAAVQPDGKLVVVGYRWEVQPYTVQMMACRFEPTGAIDLAFGDEATPGCRTVASPIGDAIYALREGLNNSPASRDNSAPVVEAHRCN